MPVLGIVLLLAGSILTLVVLAVVLVVATDRLRATVDNMLAVRGRVEPALRTLEAEAARARAGVKRIRGSARVP